MRDREYMASHWRDSQGNPAGGCFSSTGICISWQNGPLGRGEERVSPNGAFVETVIVAAKDRLELYQNSKFACAENAAAILHLENALAVLDARTKRREDQKVEGTHQGS